MSLNTNAFKERSSNMIFWNPALQRPYMTVGTLRDQIIYPDSPEEQKKNRVSDEMLEDILKKVQLGYILEREKGWESVQVIIYNVK